MLRLGGAMTEQLTAEHFLPHLDQPFQVGAASDRLTLIRVDRRAAQDWERAVLPREPFNLIFRGPPERIIPAGLYRLEVEGGPGFELYLMPIHTEARGCQDYQAAFN